MKQKRSSGEIFLKKLKSYISLEYTWVYALILIIAVAIFFRFYNMPNRYVFDFDPTRDALISLVGENNLMFPLSGPRSGIAEFTFGPWYYYFLIGFSLITPFEYAPWIFIGIASVVTVFVYFLIGRNLFNNYFGLLLAFLVAIAPSELGPVTGLSNPNLVPLHASLSVLFFILFIKNKLSFIWILIWGFIIGVGINHHYQAVGLLFLPLVGLCYRVYKKEKFRYPVLALLGGLFISFIPLLIFNVVAGWHTFLGFNSYLHEGRSAAPNRWLTYIFDFLPQFWAYVLGVPLILGVIVGVYIFCINIFAFIKKALPVSYILLVVIFIINILFLRYATSVRENYYFLYLHPFIFILWGFSIWYSLKNKYLKYLMFVLAYIVFFFVLKEDIRRLPNEEQSSQIRNYVSIVEETYPSGISVYRCGNRIRNLAQGMTFLLYHDNRLSDNGISIGIKSEECKDKSLFTGIPFDEKNGYYIMDFEKFPDAVEYWTPVTPERVYEENVSLPGK